MATPTNARTVAPKGYVLAVLPMLFLGSGAAALIYEIVWFKLLEYVVGSSTVSLGILLATYMGGLCVGSLAVPRLISPDQPPLAVYAGLELGIAVSALAVLVMLPLVSTIYVAFAGYGLLGLLLRGLIAALLLLPPTILMGATLPVAARLAPVEATGVSWLGLLYTANIAGAVLGCILAGFYLLRIHDMGVATWVAAGINLCLAAIALMLHRQGVTSSCIREQALEKSIDKGGAWIVYVVIGLSGLTALGAQIVWTRVLALMMGATVYTFSIILAIILVGLGVGSAVGAALARSQARPRLLLGACQLALVAALAWGAYVIHASLPHWPVDPALLRNPWDGFQLDIVRAMWAIFPATCLWGASFPLALAAVHHPGADQGRVAAFVYAANTVGAIVGALLFSLVLVPLIGTFQSQRVLMGAALLAAALILVSLMPARQMEAGTVTDREPTISPRAGLAGGLIGAMMAFGLVATVPAPPPGLLAFGREFVKLTPVPEVLFVGEGINSTVAVAEIDQGVNSFLVSGRAEASNSPHDMRVQRMIGHVGALLHPKPRSVLVVGFGAGVTAGSFTRYPGIERIVICEIEPLIPRVVSTYFKAQNYSVLSDPRVEVIYDDARHYLLTTRETFDVITSDPIHPWVKGAATLATRDYYEIVHRRLKPGGVVTQWVPFYETTPAVVKSQFATFFSVFAEGMIFGNEGLRTDSDTVAFATLEPRPIDVDALQRKLDSPEFAQVKASLADVGFMSVADLLATYVNRARDLKSWLKDAEINTDRNLRLQYLAGLGSTTHQGEEIYTAVAQGRRFPEDIFAGSPEAIGRLRSMFQNPAPSLR